MSGTEEITPILIVEDDQLQSTVLRKVILHFCGDLFATTRCASISEALQHLAEVKFGAILLDLDLPDSSGLNTLTTITEKYPDMPVIIMTGTDNDLLALESLKRGAQEYIVKGRQDGPALCRTISHAIERKHNEVEMKRLQDMLQQERRLEALGAIASGIAHEINTPLQFIGTNLEFIKGVFELLEKELGRINDIPRKGRLSRDDLKIMRSLVTALTEARTMALRKEVPASLSESVDGIRRVKRIITAMNVFSRTSGPTKMPYDVNHAVRDAMTITRHEWKHIADTELNLDDDLPLVPCYPVELSHCLLNLIINAVHAIQDMNEARKSRQGQKGLISVTTSLQDDFVNIDVYDSGCGIPADIQHRIFEPFFTTKDVGRGSGQGLSTVYQMIVMHMGGRLTFESNDGEGTVFTVSLPVNDNRDTKRETADEDRTQNGSN